MHQKPNMIARRPDDPDCNLYYQNEPQASEPNPKTLSNQAKAMKTLTDTKDDISSRTKRR